MQNKNSQQISWHNLTVYQVLDKVSAKISGLSSEEATRRLAAYGNNSLPEEKAATWYQILLRQFSGLLFYILLVATLVNLWLREWVDLAVILIVILLSVIIGFFEEYKAEKTLQKLRQIINPQAEVRRNGLTQKINVAEIVKGDIIILSTGMKIPADARLLRDHELTIDESVLTGESEPRRKNIAVLDPKTILAERQNMVYMGTTVVSGTGEAVVLATGRKTEIGLIADLLKSTASGETPLAKKLAVFSRWLTVAMIALSSLIFFIGLWRGLAVEIMFKMAVSVMVATLPEAILVVVTLILVLGMRRILKKSGLVRNLTAAETLGATTVICSDKTGTLTAGLMNVQEVIIFKANNGGLEKISKDWQSSLAGLKLLEGCVLANDAYIINPEFKRRDWQVAGQNTDRALLLLAVEKGLDINLLRKKFPRVDELPFSSKRGWMQTRNKINGQDVVYAKGKPEKIIACCSWLLSDGQVVKLNEQRKKQILSEQEKMAQNGLRVLALAYQEVPKINFQKPSGKFPEDKFIFLGLLGIKDALREDVHKSIAELKKAGIKLVMITGDHALIAKHIAVDLGLAVSEKEIMNGDELEKITVSELTKVADKIKIYARVSPENKLKIVQALQARGEVVAMTGDGVNDSPALKQADIGVALGSGTEVAKEAADLVLLDNNFTTIVAAVGEGRSIFNNIRKTFIYLPSQSLEILILFFGSLLLGWPLILFPAQVLWINLIIDGLPDFSLAYEPPEKNILNNPPRKTNEAILRLPDKIMMAFAGVFTGFLALTIFAVSYELTGDLAFARTMTFVATAINSVFYAISLRSLNLPFWRIKFFSNKVLIFSLIYGILLQLASVYFLPLQYILKTVSLPPICWGLVFLSAFFVLMVMELAKYAIYTLAKKYIGQEG